MGKKIISLVTVLLLLVGCLAGCGTKEEPKVNPNGLLYGTFNEFFANSKHLHPETDANLRYALYDNFVEVIECISDAETIVIPDTYKGKPVISIDKGAFANNNTLKHVTIGNNILRIHSSAFENCTALIHVTMSSTVNEINARAFAGCSALTSIIIPPRVSVIYGGTFANCTSLTKVVIESTDMLDDSAKPTEGRGQAATTVSRKIEGSAFSNCSHLKIMWIPEDIGTVSDSILGGKAYNPLVCGGDATASSQFATNQRLDYMLVDRDDFDAQARLFENVSVVDRTEIGKTLKVGNFNVTLKEVNCYTKLGSLVAGKNQTLLVAKFSIAQNTQITQYFDGLNVKCVCTAPGRDNVNAEFTKLPLMLSTEVLGMSFPVGNVNPGMAREGIIVLRVSDRFESVSIQFAGAEAPFII